METGNRLKRLRAKLIDKQLEAILITQGANRRYLSGFTGSDGYLVITQTRQVIATDFRYVEQVKREAPDFELRQISGELSSWFPGVVEGLNLKDLAVEAEDITFSQYNKLKEASDRLGIKLTPAGKLVEEGRAIKEPGEIESIIRAVALSDAAITYAARMLKPGLTELELGWEIECYMRKHGSQTLPFEVIVAAGPNSALPHAQPSARKIESGEPVVIDIGARVDGYASDLTRTLCAGKPDQKFIEIYNTVLRAQTTAEDNITAGITGHEADMLARQIIEAAGYGDNFGHGLGHGIGLVIHESPRVGLNSKDILDNGMVFTVEPGIYLPDWGGIRIEDTVVMENGRIAILSKAQKYHFG